MTQRRPGRRARRGPREPRGGRARGVALVAGRAVAELLASRAAPGRRSRVVPGGRRGRARGARLRPRRRPLLALRAAAGRGVVRRRAAAGDRRRDRARTTPGSRTRRRWASSTRPPALGRARHRAPRDGRDDRRRASSSPSWRCARGAPREGSRARTANLRRSPAPARDGPLFTSRPSRNGGNLVGAGLPPYVVRGPLRRCAASTASSRDRRWRRAGRPRLRWRGGARTVLDRPRFPGPNADRTTADAAAPSLGGGLTPRPGTPPSGG